MFEPVVQPKAIFLRSLEVLTETHDIQRRAFNAAFQGLDMPWTWNEDTYRGLLSIQDEQDRVAHWAEQHGLILNAAAIVRQKALVFSNLLTAVDVPLRPGVAELIAQANASRIHLLLMCSASAGDLDAVLRAVFPPLSRADFSVILSPEAASAKNAPQTYATALRRMGLTASQALVITDNREDAFAARAQALPVIGFPDRFRLSESFPEDVPVTGTLDPVSLSSHAVPPLGVAQVAHRAEPG